MTATQRGSQRWSNWGGNVSARPQRFIQPRSEEEVVQTVQQAAQQGLRVRVVGAGHSFTPLAATDELMLNLDHLSGLSGLQNEHPHGEHVRVKAGTRLYHLNELLSGLGRAQENMGDINRQSVAGAISTGTHGTGLRLGTLGTQVDEVRLIDSLGRRQVIGTDDPERLSAARLSLGALGVVTGITLRTLPSYRLKMQIRPGTLTEMLHLAPEYAAANRHFEFYWIPQTNRVQAKFTNVTEEPATASGPVEFLNDLVLENGALWLLCELNKAMPASTRLVCQTMGAAIGSNTRVAASHEVFGSTRLVRFVEMEYAMPAGALTSALADLRDLIQRQRYPISFPVEVRFVQGDDIMLSPAYGRDSGYIAIHAYRGVDYRRYFREAEAIFRAHDGRPHWGKWHHLNAQDFQGIYPRFQDFLDIRHQLDPERRFMNPHLRSVLGE